MSDPFTQLALSFKPDPPLGLTGPKMGLFNMERVAQDTTKYFYFFVVLMQNYTPSI